MPRYTFPFFAIAIGFSCLVSSPSAHAAELKVYAGPQSVTPGEVIYVTVQSPGSQAAIELTYMSDDDYEVLTGTTQHGLVSFEVTAQKTIGHMGFKAKAEKGFSNTAIVSVLAGPPTRLELNMKRGKQRGTIDVSSAVMTDRFDNPISDLALVSFDWIDKGGLIASQNIQLTRGRLLLNAICPVEFSGDLRIRAAVNDVAYVSPELSSFCAVPLSLSTAEVGS